MNKVFLIGNITRDLEIKYTPSGKAVVNTGLAINRKYKVEGEEKEEVCFVDVSIWNKQAETAKQYLHKGSKVLVEGRLIYHTWEKDGEKRSKLDVIAQSVTFLDAKPKTEASSDEKGTQNNYSGDGDDIPF